MHFRTLLFAGLTASGAMAHRSCGTPSPTEEQRAEAKLFAQQEAAARAAGIPAPQAAINVKVYFHVLATSNATSGGYLSVNNSLFSPQPMNAAR